MLLRENFHANHSIFAECGIITFLSTYGGWGKNLTLPEKMMGYEFCMKITCLKSFAEIRFITKIETKKYKERRTEVKR